jgi:hypothetical protein
MQALLRTPAQAAVNVAFFFLRIGVKPWLLIRPVQTTRD